jgi:hypothetical protein
MRMDCVYDFIVFFKLSGDIYTYINMAAFNLVVYCFAKVVQKSGAFGCHYISSEFCCKKTCEMGNLY